MTTNIDTRDSKFLAFWTKCIRETAEEALAASSYIRINIARIKSGDALARIAYEAKAYLFHTDETISEEAKEVAASIFDFLRDLGDIADDRSFADKLDYQRSLGELLKQLERAGAACYSAFRATKMVGVNWVDKTPLPITIGYLSVVPAEHILTVMMVPRRLS
jgi:hypothetical protein